MRLGVEEGPEGEGWIFELLTLRMADFRMISATIVGVVGLGYLDRRGTLIDDVRHLVDRALVLRRGVVPSALRAGVVE